MITMHCTILRDNGQCSKRNARRVTHRADLAYRSSLIDFGCA